MTDTSTPVVDLQEFKVLLSPRRFEADGFEAAAEDYARTVAAPAAAALGVGFAPRAVRPENDTVMFYDTPGFDFRGLNRYFLRRRMGRQRDDLTLKHRSPTIDGVLRGGVSSTFPGDAVRLENEVLLPAGGGAPGWRDAYSLDNVIGGQVLAERGFTAPATLAGWAGVFPVLGRLRDSAGGRLSGATPVAVVNGIEVEQLQATVGTLAFGGDGARGLSAEAEVMVWKNVRRQEFKEFLIAEFTYLVRRPDRGSARAREQCGEFFKALQGPPGAAWIHRHGLKTSVVYAPPRAGA